MLNSEALVEKLQDSPEMGRLRLCWSLPEIERHRLVVKRYASSVLLTTQENASCSFVQETCATDVIYRSLMFSFLQCNAFSDKMLPEKLLPE